MKARRRTDVHRARSLMRTGIRTSAHGGGDAPPHWLDVRRLRLYPLAALICYVILAIGWVVRRTVLHQPEVPPLALDFLPFWSASYLGLNGHALDAYDVIKLTRVEILVEPYMRDLNGIMPWLYPPTMLLFVLPLALLPFWVAYGVFAFGALLLFVRVVRMIAPWPQAIWPILGFPGIALVLVAGQAACLTAGLAGLSLCLLRRHAGWAGVCAGLLFVKPHLAILFPLAFLCCRAWRALAACLATALTSWLLSLVAFGPETLLAFLHGAQAAQGTVAEGQAHLFRMPTVFIMARMMHAPILVAYALHAMAALAAAVVVANAWRKPCAYPLRAAALVTASLLISPYLYDYDMVWLGLVIAWLCVHGVARGWRAGEREWLVLLWLTPLLGLVVVDFVGFQFLPFVTLTTLVGIHRKIRFEARAVLTQPICEAAT